MGVSARTLGQQYGLTAAEMNRVLVKKGILAGNPGDYYLTELGDLYGATKHFHRGCGGSAQYNRYWSERTYDESIKNVLNITSKNSNYQKRWQGVTYMQKMRPEEVYRCQEDKECYIITDEI